MKNNNLVAMKWVDEGGVFFPIDGNTKLHQSLGNKVFELYQGNGQDKRIGLKYVCDKFEFPYKIYDLGCEDLIETIKKTWESDSFVNGEKNMGVILHGTRGTGKTICSKILCNAIGMPVIIISDIKEGMIDFLQSLQFEATILIDEAEKTFKKGEDDEILLRIVDGNLNAARKLYILVVNRLDINENLLGRPGRVRYVKQFGNLTEKAVNDYIDDNLKIPGKKKDILKIVDLLEISTIDILRNIVEEVNIHGDITDNNYLNIPRAKYIFDVIKFPVCSEEKVREIKEFFKKVNSINLETWLKETHSEENGEKITNEDWIYNEFNGYVDRLTSPYSSLWRGGETNYGEILEVDDDGFISVQFYDSEYLFKIIRQRQNPSLYRGNLVV